MPRRLTGVGERALIGIDGALRKSQTPSSAVGEAGSVFIAVSGSEALDTDLDRGSGDGSTGVVLCRAPILTGPLTGFSDVCLD